MSARTVPHRVLSSGRGSPGWPGPPSPQGLPGSSDIGCTQVHAWPHMYLEEAHARRQGAQERKRTGTHAQVLAPNRAVRSDKHGDTRGPRSTHVSPWRDRQDGNSGPQGSHRTREDATEGAGGKPREERPGCGRGAGSRQLMGQGGGQKSLRSRASRAAGGRERGQKAQGEVGSCRGGTATRLLGNKDIDTKCAHA